MSAIRDLLNVGRGWRKREAAAQAKLRADRAAADAARAAGGGTLRTIGKRAAELNRKQS